MSNKEPSYQRLYRQKTLRDTAYIFKDDIDKYSQKRIYRMNKDSSVYLFLEKIIVPFTNSPTSFNYKMRLWNQLLRLRRLLPDNYKITDKEDWLKTLRKKPKKTSLKLWDKKD